MTAEEWAAEWERRCEGKTMEERRAIRIQIIKQIMEECFRAGRSAAFDDY